MTSTYNNCEVKSKSEIQHITSNILTWIIVLLLIVSSDNIILAQSNTDSIMMQEDTKKVEFTIGIPVWFPGFRGSFSIDDITIEGEGKNNELLSQLFNSESNIDYYFVGKFGVTLKKWQIQGDVFGGKFKNAIAFSYNQNSLASIEIFTIMPRLFVDYQMFEHDFERRPLKKRIEIWPYVGCRYFHVSITNQQYSVIPEFDINRKWIDPLLGFIVQMMINRFTFLFENDLGGFGLGSDLTYWFQLSAEYKVAKFLAIKLGWIYLNINYISFQKQSHA